MNLLLTIATLCQIGTSDSWYTRAVKDQLKCQQEYLRCMVTGESARHAHNLHNCILKRKIK